MGEARVHHVLAMSFAGYSRVLEERHHDHLTTFEVSTHVLSTSCSSVALASMPRLVTVLTDVATVLSSLPSEAMFSGGEIEGVTPLEGLSWLHVLESVLDFSNSLFTIIGSEAGLSLGQADSVRVTLEVEVLVKAVPRFRGFFRVSAD